MKIQQKESRCWPNKEKELLLRASLLQGENAIYAWEEWKSKIDIDQVDLATYRLLPLLYSNLSKQGVKDPLMPKLKGIYRLTWCQNQFVFNQALPVLKAFAEAGIPTMLLKGSGLILNSYKDYGLRAMSDLDVLVPAEKALDSLTVLEKMGWKTPVKNPVVFFETLHAIPYKNESNKALDLHRHIFHECLQENADDEFWNAAIPAQLGDFSTLTLSPTDQLLHVCVHGARGNVFPPVRWLADSMIILKEHSAEIDWDRLINFAQQRQLTLRIKDTMIVLQQLLDAPIPNWVLEKIEQIPTSKLEKLEHQVITTPIKPGLDTLIKMYFFWLRTENNLPLKFKFLGYFKYLQKQLELEYFWQLPFEIVRRTVRRICLDLLAFFRHVLTTG